MGKTGLLGTPIQCFLQTVPDHRHPSIPRHIIFVQILDNIHIPSRPENEQRNGHEDSWNRKCQAGAWQFQDQRNGRHRKEWSQIDAPVKRSKHSRQQTIIPLHPKLMVRSQIKLVPSWMLISHTWCECLCGFYTTDDGTESQCIEWQIWSEELEYSVCQIRQGCSIKSL